MASVTTDGAVANASRELIDEGTDTLLTAARDEFEAVGLSRSSLDVIARSAGMSRSTLYRRFKDKEALILAVVERLLASTMRDLDAATRGHTPQDAVVAAFVAAVRALNSSRLFRRILFEDSSLIRGLVSSVREWTVGEVAHRVSRTLRRAGAQMPDHELLVASELLVRIASSYAENPSTLIRFDDEAAVRTFAQSYLANLVY